MERANFSGYNISFLLNDKSVIYHGPVRPGNKKNVMGVAQITEG